MTLRHYAIFIAVCKKQSMTAAAKDLHMTQPSISQAIRELEEHFNVLLFERLRRRLYITPAGQRLLNFAKQIIELNQRAERTMNGDNYLYPIRLGASLTIGETLLVNTLQQIKNTLPAQPIISEIHNTEVLQNKLLDGSLDIALVEGDITSPYLKKIPFTDDELVPAFSSSLWNPNNPSITLEELCQFPLFLREKGSGTRNLFEQTIRKEQINYHVIGIYNNSESIKNAVMAGLGATVISRRLIENEIKDGRILSPKLENVRLSRIFTIVYHQHKFISPALQTIIQIAHTLK